MLDILIIGSGGAGLTSALSAKEMGASVLVVGKSLPTVSQTSMAQGGMNASLGNVGKDAIALHIKDTIKSARGLCDEDMVGKMCGDAPKTIAWLESLGVPFSRLDNGALGIGSIAQRQMGGASAKRACYAQDYTGLKILHTLYDTCLKHEIDFLDEHYLLNLVVEDAVAKGAIFLDIQSGKIKQIDAKSVIVASGGYGALYHGYSTNAYGVTGDGVASVLRKGGAVSDMEFVQFHPTALKGSSILISESARGEGGYLVNSEGERFINELKPRDEVARAIFAEFQDNKEVFLDLRHLGNEKLMALLPQEVALCKFHENIDPATQLIPIKSVAHYTMGGIDVNSQLKVKGIQGCFAVGECANAKVHGANRLGGNSLLEITAFGRLVGENAYHYTLDISDKKAENTQLRLEQLRIAKLYNEEPSKNFYEYRESLGKLLYEKVGIVRENENLHLAKEAVAMMEEFLKDMGIADKSFDNNQNLVEFLEFSNALLLSSVLISSAIERDESRGAHYKLGFEMQDDVNFARHSFFQMNREEA
ncbi:Succinate dehydrogenase flavoprotein subunit [hydrothermal vent metagenome]|uniref:Succinate dehydrogenase flavoprotein subunit n=1 Tax=hydrothermal vent metagenome TaxID=652676 RepID=A0A1W1D1B0_9ZZZZ